jgi:hypothetical protein
MNGQRSSGTSVIVGFLLGIIVATAVAAVGWWLLRMNVLGTRRVDTSRPTVLSQVRRLERLETVVFGMDKIVVGERNNPYLPRFLAGERLLLIVFGEVTAGVDLGRIKMADVLINDRTIQLTIPKPEIFSTRLDNDRTRVYSRETGLFTRVDPELETNVRREAEGQVRRAALDGGILEVATKNARTTLTSFLQGLGFEHADVR